MAAQMLQDQAPLIHGDRRGLPGHADLISAEPASGSDLALHVVGHIAWVDVMDSPLIYLESVVVLQLQLQERRIL
jgi:hypothetical protein